MAAPPLELVPRHRRAQIRVAAAQDLLGLPTTGANVYPGRRFRLGELTLPALLVYTDAESSEAIAMGMGAAGRSYDREVALVIQAVADAPEGELEDLLDRIGREVEVRIFEAIESGVGQSQLKRLNISQYEIQASEVSAEPEGARLLGSLAMTWSLRYSTREDDPATEA